MVQKEKGNNTESTKIKDLLKKWKTTETSREEIANEKEKYEQRVTKEASKKYQMT